MADYRLTRRAEKDLLDIYVYGMERFGEAQAARYHQDMSVCFELLASRPRMGRLAAAIAPGVRRHEHGSHVILYEEDREGVLILALVHQRSVRGLKL
ncbi:MAG: type II toxin-antitoxin system RelE/ParE family toxin [Alphaproteobacteria bacterium]|nr:type II toxin-antitoxin system RelE/ParE family toxin [Alphaproteobacteria bacterium]